MSNHKSIPCVAIMILIAASLSACNVLPAASTPVSGSPAAAPTAALPPVAPASPKPGKWTGSAEFGSFGFIVSPNGTGITKITYNFAGKCGPTTKSGGIGIGQETGWEGWPISGGRFTIQNTLDPGQGKQTMTINGTFDPSGAQASGDWKGTSHGTNCSGAWTASFSE